MGSGKGLGEEDVGYLGQSRDRTPAPRAGLEGPLVGQKYYVLFWNNLKILKIVPWYRCNLQNSNKVWN